MSNQIDITGGARVRGLNGVITGTTGVLSSLPINTANGIPQLDSSGKILVSQLPNSVMEFLGTWNATTNTPTLANGTGNAGDVYLCNVAGTVNFGAGPIAFIVGDYVVYSGSTWERSGGAVGTVTSVAASITGNSVGLTGSPITTAGTLAFAFAGTNLQYINGAGNLTTFPSLAGYVTSVTATAPLVSSGGTTPDLSIPVASSTVDGYLDNADWTIFNAKQDNLTFYSPLVKSGVSVTIPQATGTVDGFLDSADWTTFNNKQNAITLTTTGTSGVSTLIGSTLNIPNYSTDLSGYVPYTGATANVDLGTFDLTTDIINLNQLKAIGSGGLNIYSNSGTHIALMGGGGGAGTTFYGGIIGTSISLSSTLTASSLIKTGGTSSQFLKADGSVDSSTYALDSAVVHLAGTETITGAKTFSALSNFDNVIRLKQNLGSYSTIAGYTTLFSTEGGGQYGFGFYNAGGALNSLNFTTASTNAYTFPSASGTIALTSDIPSSTLQSNWTTAYNRSLTNFTINYGVSGTSLILTKQDASTLTLGLISGGLTSGNIVIYNGSNLAYVPLNATAPLSYNAGSQTFTISQANTSTNGYLSSTDWTTFNGKQNAITNPITGTGTTNTLPKFTAASTIGDSNITDTGSLITLGSNSFVNGLFGIGSTPVGSSSIFYISNNITGGTACNGVYLLTNVLSDVTSQARGFVSNIGTQTATFTLSNLTHYRAEQGIFRGSSVVTTQVGYLASDSIIGATNNYAFQGSIPSGTNRWNLYMNGTANNYIAGSLGIGTTSLTGYTVRLSKNITGSTASFAVRNEGVVQSDVTADAIGFRNDSNTATAAFTLVNYWHFWARQGSIGAGSAITNQYGYVVDSNMIGATNNFAFQGNIPSGTNRWNLYMAGTAANYMAGNLNIGTTLDTGSSLQLYKSYLAGVYSLDAGTGGIAGISEVARFYSNGNGGAGRGVGIVLGAAGSTNTVSVARLVGYQETASATANNASFAIQVANSSGTLTEAIRITNTQSVGFGISTPNASAKVQIDSTTQGFLPPRGTNAQRTAIASPAVGLVFYCTDATEGLYIYTSSGWKSLTMV